MISVYEHYFALSTDFYALFMVNFLTCVLFYHIIADIKNISGKTIDNEIAYSYNVLDY